MKMTYEALRWGSGLMVLVASLGTIAAGCKAPEYCTAEARGTSFPELVNEEWEPYCEKFETYLDSGMPDIVEYTRILAAHPVKAGDLRRKVKRFPEPEACFEEPSDKLRFRRLSRCIEDDPGMQAELASAWSAQAEVWLEEVRFRRKKAKRLDKEAQKKLQILADEYSEQVQYKSQMEPRYLEEYQSTLREFEKHLEFSKKALDKYNQMLEIASVAPTFQEDIRAYMAEEMKFQKEDIAELEEHRATHENQEKFFVMASASVGKSCPSGKEREPYLRRLAREKLGDKRSDIGAGRVYIDTVAEVTKKGPVFYETFQGHVCGKRSEENQVEGRPPLCSVWRFSVQRARGDNTEKWDEWQLVNFEETGPDGGIDCREIN